MLVFAVRVGLANDKLVPNRGRVLMVIGFALAVATRLVDMALGLLLPESFVLLQPQLLHGLVPHWLYWVITRISYALVAIGLLLAIWQSLSDEKEFRESKEEAKAAGEIVIRSEARFRHLYETTSDSVYCFSFDPPMPVSLPIDAQIKRSHDAILTECNQPFAQALGAQSPSDVIGWRMGAMDSNADEEAHNHYFRSLIENDYSLTDYEMLYTDPGGQERALNISITGIVKDGLLHRFWGVENDILDLRQTKAALARRRKFQDLLATISSRLIMADIADADDAINNCIRRVCEYVKADRTSIIYMDQGNNSVDIQYDWEMDGIPKGPDFELKDFPEATSQVFNGEIVRIDDVEQLTDDWSTDRESAIARGLKSFIAVPLIADGKVVGASTYANVVNTRVFDDQDVADLRAYTDLFASYLLRLRSSRALDEALSSLRKATERLDAENVYLREEIELTLGFDEIIGRSESMMHCLHLVERVAVTNAPVLILGETGTGKELIARAIHENSDRRDRPLVKINCAALPANLIESELFGYEKGAFTGADRPKRGRFDVAHGSSIFLDEFGDIPFELQAKLLRVLQEGEFERLGGDKTYKADVRVIAATNRNIAEAARTGEFRSDLLYRINAFPIEVPALRERGNDIQLLAEHFVRMYSQRLGRDTSAISARMMEQLREYSWPGNIRELEGVIQRALISSTTEVLELAVPLTTRISGIEQDKMGMSGNSRFVLEDVERQHILSVLEGVNWKIAGDSGAASKLGIPPSTLRSKMQKLSIYRPGP